jgi:hypothetical protein
MIPRSFTFRLLWQHFDIQIGAVSQSLFKFGFSNLSDQFAWLILYDVVAVHIAAKSRLIGWICHYNFMERAKKKQEVLSDACDFRR